MSKWFKNKETGLIWEVEGDLEKRLARNPDYEEVSAPKKNKSDDSPSYNDLKAKAKDLGIDGYTKMNKEELFAAVAEAEKESAELSELQAKAKESGVEGFESMTKEQLLEALKVGE